MHARTLAVLGALAAGCVPKGKHELVEVQLEATRAALSTSEAACRIEAAQANDTLSRLQGAGVVRDAEMDGLARALRASQEEFGDLARREAEHVLEDVVECPVPDPETDETPPDTPEVERRRVHIDASVDEVAKALEVSARQHVVLTHAADHQARVEAAFASLVDDELATVTREGNVSVVSLLVAKLFNENRTTLSPLGVSLLERLAEALRALPGDTLQIVGHTDDQPVHTATHASNWELGFAYAMSVQRELEYLEIPMRPTPGSAAGTRPVASTTDAPGRRLNRRVELRLSSEPATVAPEETPEP